MSVEHSRKYGAFDPRYPPIPHTPASASLWRFGEERLDWRGFLARFFPGSCRHDFDVLAAYESYVNDVEGRPPGDVHSTIRLPGALPVAVFHTTQRSDDGREWPAVADTDRWEADGGASTADSRQRRRGERPDATQTV